MWAPPEESYDVTVRPDNMTCARPGNRKLETADLSLYAHASSKSMKQSVKVPLISSSLYFLAGPLSMAVGGGMS